MHPHASLNKSFRLVWNATTAVWQAVSEIGSGHGKGHSARTLRRTGQTALTSTALVLAGQAMAATVLPTEFTVEAGQASMQQSGNAMTITQQSARMAATVRDFSIGPDNTVQVIQPSASAVALFRVLGHQVSVIEGRLIANGHVFLQNPNGVLFAPGAQVDVGSLVASTLNLSVTDFMAGNYQFEGSSNASITNQGRITAHGDNNNGGTIALVAARIVNEGTLTADRGQVLLGAGSQVLLDLGGPVKLEVQQGTLDALITNGGAIRADGGTVLLTAKALGDLSRSVINHTGLVQAQTLDTNERGEITLLAPGEQITVAGTLDASALQGGSGGRIVATGTRVLVEDGAHLTASGKNGGGEVLVGGSWQNSNPAIYQATQTLVKAGAVLEADATDVGDGGTVVAWSDIHKADSTTQAYGKFSAKGGARGGDGGRIETSGYWLDVAGITANASAAMGRSGQWLLDPYNITISSSATTAGPGFPGWTSAADSSVVQNTDIEAQLNTGTSVTIATGSGGAQAGNISVTANITKTAGTDATLTLQAHNGIEINAGTSITSSVGALNVVLNSDSDATGGGYVWLGKGNSPGAQSATTITTNGGSLTLGGGSNASGYAQGSTTGTSNGIVLDKVDINTGGGNIVMRGKSAVSVINISSSDAASSANTDGIRFHGSNLINSGTGTIAFTGVAQGTSGASNGIETSESGYTRITSAATNTTAISFSGDATQGTATGGGWGTFLWGTNSSGIVLAATGTGGGITLTGSGRNSTFGGGVHLNPNAFVLASSGPIAITGTKGAASTYEDIVINSTVGYVATLPGGFGVASPVTASSSNITLTADSLSANRVFSGATFSNSAVQSTGILTIAPRTAGKAMAVQTANPGGTAFWINPTSMFGASGLFKTGFSKLVFGSSTTGNVTLDNYSFNNDTEINTSGNAVLGAVTIANGKALTVNMTGSGSITDTGTVAVANLKLNGSTSAVTLDSAANAIGTVAGTVASLTLSNSTALTVGSVGGTNGITATGNIDIATLSGDLTVSQNISTSSTSASAIILNAGKSAAPTTTTGGNIVLSGSRSFTTGSGGRAVLYSGDDAGSTGLSTLVFAANGTVTGNADESTNPTATSGVNAVFRGTPPVAPVVTPPSTPATTPTTNTSTASVTPAVQNAQQLPVEPPKPVNVALPAVPAGAGGSSGSSNFELSTNGGLRFLDLPANTLPGTGIDTAVTGGTAGTTGSTAQGSGSVALANAQSGQGAQGGIDPFGFMRVFVTGGGITLPSPTAFDSTQENDANQNP
ncbi:filamentous hemagglutinin N-terminal domain-containing protein [Rhodoferax saidenbachensis]|uniref:Bulb-type lectin domain-containing protein n=1 Tax=Rhodoferax saidenbachensis TaxID=1484693 RepID=A0A1P8KEB5_9BURK|nr:filamentous hemagglutinin N-terminal domain-containing protein [Rhodoferax saidenbachensis]APW44322.1 hypothetical protein RS694_18540 [Rhodoferax saidenbachensis]